MDYNREKNSGPDLCVSSPVDTTGTPREIKRIYRQAAVSCRPQRDLSPLLGALGVTNDKKIRQDFT